MVGKQSNHHPLAFRAALLHPRHWPTWLGMLLLFLFSLLPMGILDAAGNRLGEYVARKNRKRFNIASTNLRLCFPDKDEGEISDMVRAHFRAQLRSALHYPLLWWWPGYFIRRRIRTEGFDQIERIREQGRQVIVLLSHTAGLDFAVTAFGMQFSVSGPYKPVRNPVVDWWIARGRLRFCRHGGMLFTRQDGLRPLIRETRSGKVLVYLADEDLGEGSSVFAPFYGMPKSTIAVLGRLAKACRAEVMPCISCYDEVSRQYRVKLLPPIEGLSGKDDIADATLMNQAIERTIAVCPSQYLWTFRYFQTRPPGEAPVYD